MSIGPSLAGSLGMGQYLYTVRYSFWVDRSGVVGLPRPAAADYSPTKSIINQISDFKIDRGWATAGHGSTNGRTTSPDLPPINTILPIPSFLE